MGTGTVLDLWGEDYVDPVKFFCVADRCDRLGTSPRCCVGEACPENNHSDLRLILCLQDGPVSRAESVGETGDYRVAHPVNPVNEPHRFGLPRSCHGGSNSQETSSGEWLC